MKFRVMSPNTSNYQPVCGLSVDVMYEGENFKDAKEKFDYCRRFDRYSGWGKPYRQTEFEKLNADGDWQRISKLN